MLQQDEEEVLESIEKKKKEKSPADPLALVTNEKKTKHSLKHTLRKRR